MQLYVCNKLVKETDKEENLYNVILFIIIVIIIILVCIIIYNNVCVYIYIYASLIVDELKLSMITRCL